MKLLIDMMPLLAGKGGEVAVLLGIWRRKRPGEQSIQIPVSDLLCAQALHVFAPGVILALIPDLLAGARGLPLLPLCGRHRYAQTVALSVVLNPNAD